MTAQHRVGRWILGLALLTGPILLAMAPYGGGQRQDPRRGLDRDPRSPGFDFGVACLFVLGSLTGSGEVNWEVEENDLSPAAGRRTRPQRRRRRVCPDAVIDDDTPGLRRSVEHFRPAALEVRAGQWAPRRDRGTWPPQRQLARRQGQAQTSTRSCRTGTWAPVASEQWSTLSATMLILL